MSFIRRPGFWFLTLSLSLYCVAVSQSFSTTSAAVLSQTPAETELRGAAEKYFRFIEAKDLNGLMALWSEKSPDYSSARHDFERQFGEENASFETLTISLIKVEYERGELRTSANVKAVGLKDKRSRDERATRNFSFIRADGKWKIWRCAAAEDDLAEALIKAEGDAKQRELLSREKELATPVLTRSLHRRGNMSYSQGQYPQAMTIYRLTGNVAEQIGDRAGLGRALSGVGNVYWAQGDFTQAHEHYLKGLAIGESLGDKAIIARAMNSLGNIHSRQSDYPKALEHYQKFLTMSEALGEKVWISTALNNIGTVLNNQGRYDEALDNYKKSMAMSEAVNDQDGVAFALNNIGSIHNRQGEYSRALDSYRKAMVVRESLGDKPGIARLLRAIGEIHYQQGDYPQALKSYQEARTTSEALGDKFEVANILNNLGLVYRQQSDYASALESFEKSLALSRTQGVKAMIAVTLSNIGTVYDLQGDQAQGLEYFRKSLALKEEIGDKSEISHTLNSIGIALMNERNFAEADRNFEKSLTLKEELGSKEGVAATLYNLGIVQHLQGNAEKALGYFRRGQRLSEELGDKARIASALRFIALVYQTQGEYAKALESAEKAVPLARSIGANETLVDSLTVAGQASRRLNRPVEARAALEEAIRITETLRDQVAGGEQEQQRFFESRVSPFPAMVDLLMEQKNIDQALTFSERARGRVLLDALRTGRVDIGKAMTEPEREKERVLRAEISALNAQLALAEEREKPDQAKLAELKRLREKARLDYEAFRTSIYAAHPELRIVRGEAPVITAGELAALIPDRQSALLEYVVTDAVVHLFVVVSSNGKSGAETHAVSLPIKREELSKQIDDFRRLLAKRDLDFRASARRLYDALLKPAQPWLRGKTSIVIAPDDKLWDLPFQALIAEDRRFLIEASAVSYAPSLTVLREMRARRHHRPSQTTSGLLALGNPVLGKETTARAAFAVRDGRLDPLPEAEQEVKSLGRLYGAGRSKVYTGSEAREDRAKAEAGGAEILHFATHGILNNASPMYSHLVLAPGDKTDKTEDGLLEAWEIMQMDLNADLAVLSACETARGRVGAGEGVIGLSWAMFVAGVPSIVVSQWKVESAATRELMLGFHQRLQETKTVSTKGEALRQAALKVMKNPETSHPFYWAGFVLIGDSSRR